MSIIRFIFSGDTKQLTKAGDDAKKTLKDLRKEFRDGVTSSAKYAAATAAAGAAIATYLVKNSLDAIDAQAKLSRTLGTTVKGLEVTTRAAELSGVAFAGVEQATKDLTRRLSQAAAGAGPAVDALTRLHLTAEDLGKLPLDERIYTINKAISDFIPKAEQAAVAGQLFGEEGSLAMQRIDPATLQQAAADVERLGSALSEVDAAKVEMANDAIARVSQVVDGLVNRFTVELAPVLTALADQFTEVAATGDALRDGPGRAFDELVKGAAFTMDAAEGVKRVFQAAGQVVAVVVMKIKENILTIADTIVNGPIRQANALIDQLNKIPGVDIPVVQLPPIAQRLQDEVHLAGQAVTEGWATIQETLNEPLPGGQFLQFVEEARAAGQEAAEAMAAAKEAASTVTSGPAGQFFTEQEKEQIQARLDAVIAAHASEEEALRLKLESEQEILTQAYEAKLVGVEEYHARKNQIEYDYEAELTRVTKEAADARKKIADAEAQARMNAIGGMLSDLSTLMNSESRKMFEIGKAAAIGQTIISTIQSAQESYKALAGIPVVGPALGAAAAAAAVASGMGRVQAIRSQSFGGGGAPAVSNTQAVNAASTPVGGGGGQSGGTYRFEGLQPGSFVSSDMVVEMLKQAQKDGALRGQVEFG